MKLSERIVGVLNERPWDDLSELLNEAAEFVLSVENAPKGEVWQHVTYGGENHERRLLTHLIIDRTPADGLAVIGKRIAIVEVEDGP